MPDWLSVVRVGVLLVLYGWSIKKFSGHFRESYRTDHRLGRGSRLTVLGIFILILAGVGVFLVKELLKVLSGSQEYTIDPQEVLRRFFEPVNLVGVLLGLVAGVIAFRKVPKEKDPLGQKLWVGFYLGSIVWIFSLLVVRAVTIVLT